jgi:hypothetical protein
VDLTLTPPDARYGIATMTLSKDGTLVEVGPRLVATYDHHRFEFLPEHEVVEPLCWEVITTFGALENPTVAVELYCQLRETVCGGYCRNAPRVWPATQGLLAREMGAS